MTITKDENLLDYTVDGEPAGLTKDEYGLMEALSDNPGKALSRRELLDMIGSGGAEERYVDTLVSRIRKKLDGSGIRSKFGYGYYCKRRNEG